MLNILNKKSEAKKQIEQKQSELMLILKNSTNNKQIESTFSQLYDSLFKSVWVALNNKFIPPLNYEELEDCFQDGWIKVLENRRYYDKDRNVYNWIFTIIKNQTIDKIRKISRVSVYSYDNEYEKDDEDRFVLQIGDTNPIADEKMIGEEEIRLMRTAIESLDDDLEKQIVIKRVYEELKLEDISKELAIPLATVHYKLKKALKKLKPVVEKIFKNID